MCERDDYKWKPIKYWRGLDREGRLLGDHVHKGIQLKTWKVSECWDYDRTLIQRKGRLYGAILEETRRDWRAACGKGDLWVSRRDGVILLRQKRRFRRPCGFQRQCEEEGKSAQPKTWTCEAEPRWGSVSSTEELNYVNFHVMDHPQIEVNINICR
jgi:hypothetical protein